MKYLLAEAECGMKTQRTLNVISRFDTYEEADEAAEDRFHCIYFGPPSVKRVDPRSDAHDIIYRYALIREEDFYKYAKHQTHAQILAEQSIHDDLDIVFCDQPLDPYKRGLPTYSIDWASLPGIGATTAERIEKHGFSSYGDMLVHLHEVDGVGEQTRQEVIQELAIYDWSELVDEEQAVKIHKRCRDIDGLDEAIAKADELFPRNERDRIVDYLEIEKALQ